MRLSRVVFDLLTQAFDMHGQCVAVHKLAHSIPQFVKQLAPCDNAFGAVDKHQEQPIFQSGKKDLIAVLFHNTACHIYMKPDISKVDGELRFCAERS